MYIHEAAEKALEELGVPTHVSALLRHIVDKGYYDFGAQSPENALAIQLSRKSNNVDIGHSSPEKRFYRAAPATYGLIEWLDVKNEQTGDSQRSAEFEDDVHGILQGKQAPTTKEQLVLARVGQGQFRKVVLELWNERCAVTGTRFAVRASHIKPWRDCSDVERLDANNGLPLVATLDALFDSYLISFNTEGRIMLSSHLSAHEWTLLGVASDMLLRMKPTIETEQYLKKHREHMLTIM